MIIPVFEASERTICRLLPYNWLTKQLPKAAATVQLTDVSIHGMRKASQLAGSFVDLEQALSRRLSSVTTGQLGRVLSASRQAPYVPQNSNTVTEAGLSEPQSADVYCKGIAQPDVFVAENSSGLSKSCSSTAGPTAFSITASGPAAAEAPRASLLLRLLNRTVITGCMVLVACALPFFGGIMGFFGESGRHVEGFTSHLLNMHAE